MCGFLSLFILWGDRLLGQQSTSSIDSPVDPFEKRMELREKFHQKLFDQFFHGAFSDDDFFRDMDQMMDDMMNESFGSFHSFSGLSRENFKLEWSESADGRTLTLIPHTPEQQLDINVTDGLVEIRGKTETKSASGVSVSNFSNAFSVPSDCDASKLQMKQKDGKIVMFFPFQENREIKKIKKIKKIQKTPGSDRRPLPPSEGDVQI